MAEWRGETPDNRPEDPEEDMHEREKPEAERQDVLEAPAADPARQCYPTSRDRARARLGREGCVICQAEECYCAVVDQLRALRCGHAAGASGLCVGCLAEVIVGARRGGAQDAYRTGRRLVAVRRLTERRRRSAA